MDEAIQKKVKDIKVDQGHLKLCIWTTLTIYIHV